MWVHTNREHREHLKGSGFSEFCEAVRDTCNT